MEAKEKRRRRKRRKVMGDELIGQEEWRNKLAMVQKAVLKNVPFPFPHERGEMKTINFFSRKKKKRKERRKSWTLFFFFG